MMKIRQGEFLNQIQIEIKWINSFAEKKNMALRQNFTYISLGNVSGLDDLPLLHPCDEDPAEQNEINEWLGKVNRD